MRENPNENSVEENVNSDQPTEDQNPSIAIPKGGGAIQSIGEKFQANPVTGTGSMSVPVALSPGRNGFTPQLSLSYDSGNGNGIFGMGWSLGIPSITRKTAKGLPRYQDDLESDTFILAGSEDLVPSLDPDNDWAPFVRTEGDVEIKNYRPRTEGLFAKIEKHRNTITGITHWVVTTKDNITSVYGQSASARVNDPENEAVIFQWMLEYTFDEKGNITWYEYKQEDGQGVDPGSISEKNRLANGHSNNKIYPKYIRYSPDTSFNPDAPGFDLNNYLSDSLWHFQLAFDYGEHTSDTITEDSSWTVRPDAFSDFRAGFEQRTYRLCKRVMLFHHFPGDLGADPVLVKSTDMQYDENPILTKVNSVTQRCYEGGQPSATYPPVSFTYSEAILDPTVHGYNEEDMANLPVGVDGQTYRWVDLHGEGLSGILTEDQNAWYYKSNLGDENYYKDLPANAQPEPEARLGVVTQVAERPSLANLTSGSQQLTDLDGNGTTDLVLNGGVMSGYYEKGKDGHWQNFVAFENSPNVNWNDPNLKVLDVDGDGFPDLLITEERCFTYYRSLGKKGYEAARKTERFFNEEHGPNVVFADQEQSIYLADMSGDGLTDIVRIKNGSVCYWPNMGHARFGAKVTFENSPYFDHQDIFDQKRIRLGDIDGSGTTDIVYLAGHEIRYYPNQSGNSFGAPVLIDQNLSTHSLANLSTLDILGNGTQCLVWSSPVEGDLPPAIKYIDLMGGVKPHLVTEVDNNMGSITKMKYAPSTKFYLRDQRNGTPWITKLPFPVQVVEQVEIWDAISHNRFVSKYAYHHGYFDGVEREFRGFGMVEQWDTENITDYVQDGGLFPPGFNESEEVINVPPIHTKTWFHTGFYPSDDINEHDAASILAHYATEYWTGDPDAFQLPRHFDIIRHPEALEGTNEPVLREAARALKGSPLRQEVYSQDGSSQEGIPYTVTENTYDLHQIQPSKGHPVPNGLGSGSFESPGHPGAYLVTPGETLSYQYERNASDPRVSHQMTLDTDEYGHVLVSAAIGYGRRASQRIGHVEQDNALITVTENTVINEDANANFYRLGVPSEAKTYELTGASHPELVSGSLLLSEFQSAAAIPFDATPDGSLQKRLLDHSHILYYDEGLTTTPLAHGQVASHGLPYETYKLALTPGLQTDILNDGETRVDAAILTEGAYLDLNSDGHYWLPSGRAIFDPSNFFVQTAQLDPFGNQAIIDYDVYWLLPNQTTDAIGNITLANYDYRVLQPVLVTDPNGNRQAFAFDVRGMVTKIAVMGKVGELVGDTLDSPTSEFSYDLFQWSNEQKPNSAYTRTRERHENVLDFVNPTPVNVYQLNLSTNGANEAGWIDLNGDGFGFGDSNEFTIDGGIKLYVPGNGWLPGGAHGATTGDDSGVYPDSILGTFWAGSSGAGNFLELRGLDVNRRYDLDFLAGRNADGNNSRTHNFIIQGATSVQIDNYNASDNTSNLAQVEKIQPDANGVIRITDNLVGDTFWRINAIALREFEVYKTPETYNNLEDTYQLNLSVNGASVSDWIDINGDGFNFSDSNEFTVDGDIKLYVPASGWLPGGSVGAVTGDNSGAFPDAILQGHFAGNSGAGNYLELRGLDLDKRYEIDFLAGRQAQGNNNRLHDYVIQGATTYEINDYNASDNVSELAQVPKMAPDSSGVIRITDNLNGDNFWRMNALVLRVYTEELRYQESYAYSNGLGQVVMTKQKVADGLAYERDGNGDLMREPDDSLSDPVQTSPRWVGNGRTVLDNKGNPVKQYEPYFSSTSDYETEAELVEYGVTPIIHYDPLGRAIKTDLPDDTLTRVEFTPWEQKNYDQNDTVLESLWFVERNSPDPAGSEPSNSEERAAWLAAQHANTPQVVTLDALGRPFITTDKLKADDSEDVIMTTQLDIKGNPLQITDAKGRVAFTYVYDMLNQPLKTTHLDNGTRYAVANVVSNPLRTWDDRGNAFRYAYDALQRPTHTFLSHSELVSESLISLSLFGEQVTNPEAQNLRGQAYLAFDGAGMIKNTAFDFKGNLLASERQLATAYQTTPDWITLDGLNITDTLTNAASQLETEVFATSNVYDALNRPIGMTKPDQSQVLPIYDEGGQLLSVGTRLRGAAVTTDFVTKITYNARGQRDRIDYANDAYTDYFYDPKTFRLTRLLTRRNTGSNPKLMDLNYTFDPVGNIVKVEDNKQEVNYYDNNEVQSNMKYAYDPLYRLTNADGRELIGLGSATHVDQAVSPSPNDATAMQRYTQEYAYDELGNILQMIHSANSGSWNKYYHYGFNTAGDANNNLLLSTSNDNTAPTVDDYTYDAHGNMTKMPHLASIGWDHADRMQSANLGGGGTAYYTYDSEGNRVRKVIDRGGGLIHERIYLGDYEVYREIQTGVTQLERETLHISDDTGRIALVDTLTIDSGSLVASPVNNIRYQFGNHLGSAALELDDTAAIISYEEYHPFGTTSYRAGRNAAETSLKRYRYVGKERDDETGLYYYGARYYAAWLARFVSVDPLKDDYPQLNPYNYASNSPVTSLDLEGLQNPDEEVRTQEQSTEKTKEKDVPLDNFTHLNFTETDVDGNTNSVDVTITGDQVQIHNLQTDSEGNVLSESLIDVSTQELIDILEGALGISDPNASLEQSAEGINLGGDGILNDFGSNDSGPIREGIIYKNHVTGEHHIHRGDVVDLEPPSTENKDSYLDEIQPEIDQLTKDIGLATSTLEFGADVLEQFGKSNKLISKIAKGSGILGVLAGGVGAGVNIASGNAKATDVLDIITTLGFIIATAAVGTSAAVAGISAGVIISGLALAYGIATYFFEDEINDALDSENSTIIQNSNNFFNGKPQVR